MPWKECSVVDERLRFVAQLLDGEAMSEVCRATAFPHQAAEVDGFNRNDFLQTRAN
jgi:hypothetical protein